MNAAAVFVAPEHDDGDEVCELKAVVPKSQMALEKVAAVAFLGKIAAPMPH